MGVYDLTQGSVNAIGFNNNNEKFGAGCFGTTSGGAQPWAYLPLGTSPIPTLPPFTVECWVKNFRGSGINSPNIALSQDGVFWIGNDASGNATAFLGTSTALSTTTNINNSTYHHIRLVCGTSSTTLSVDGAEVASGGALSTYSPNFTAGRFIVSDIDNSPPTGSNFTQYTSGYLDEVAVFDIALPANYTVPTAAYTGTEPGIVALYHFENNLSNSAVPTDAGTATITVVEPTASGTATNQVTVETGTGTGIAPAPQAQATSSQFIAPSDPSFLYSPGNWLISAAAAETIYAGAYFQQTFTGSGLTLNFDISQNVAPFPEISINIDEQGPQVFNLAPTISALMPARTIRLPQHTFRMTVKSTNYSADRWNEQQTRVAFTGISLSSGGSAIPAVPRNTSILVLGDDVPEGIDTAYSSGTAELDAADATLAFPYILRGLLGAEIGISAFYGSGLTVGQAPGGVPPLASTWNYLWSQEPRSLAGFDLIIIYIGQNDNLASSSTVQTAMQTLLQTMLVEIPSSTTIAVLEPFSGMHGGALSTAVQQVGSRRAQFIPTTGFMASSASPDGIHPYGGVTIGQVAPLIAQQLVPFLQGNTVLYQPSFGGGF